MEKGDATAAVTRDDPLSGVIRFEVDKVSSLDFGGRNSPEIEVGGVPWKMNVCKDTDESGDFLSLYLVGMNNQSRQWSIDVKFDIVLVNKGGKKNVADSLTHTFSCEEPNIGKFILEWSDVLDETKGFIKNGSILAEIRFSIVNMRGIRVASLIDFTDPSEPRHDATLIISGKKIYVSKQMLAFHSPFFNAMFYGDFKEKSKNVFELEEIDREEFIEMLQVIYPTGKCITDDSVEFLLKLGDRFQMKSLLDLSENHLISAAEHPLSLKILLSDQYRLIKLQDHCLNQLTSAEQVKRIKTYPEYKELSDATKVALLEKLC